MSPLDTVNLRIVALLMLAAVPVASAAQDSAQTQLAPVRVTVTREVARPALEVPFAVSRVDVSTNRVAVRRANLTDLLFAIPGLTASTRYNPTQDPRLSVRGFGARSAFGIRGVRILRDGIPLTLADGQTAVDLLDLETIDGAEVLRGSAGALYGNSSGGVVDFRTPPPPSSGSRAQLRMFSADGIVRGSLSGGAATPVGRWQGVLTRNYGDGPRQYSAFSSNAGFLDGRWSLGGAQWQAQVTRYDAPNAENPGALTLAELDTAFTVADAQNVRKHASKSVRQTLVSLSSQRDIGHGDLSASLFGGTRQLDNPQAFAIVAFDRSLRGGSLRGNYRFDRRLPIRLTAGVDVLTQRDNRANYNNCAGLTGTQRTPALCPTSADRGSITLNQLERVTSAGTYARGEAQLAPAVALSAAVRVDKTRFSVLELRPTSPGVAVAPTRTVGATTPMVGINWRLRPLASLYVNYAESFETPTTTELANQPDGSGGLNTELQPQRGKTFEAGTKGILASRLRYDLALFHVRTVDELIPFEIPNSNGRRFFRNAGVTSRRGAEVALSGDAGPMTLGGSWNAIRYRYDEYVVTGTSYDGKHVPGVAPVTWTLFANARAHWGVAALEWQHAAKTAADDANLNFAPAYSLLNVRTNLHWGERFGIEPSMGIDNVTDRHYAANIVTNAARSRFYESGPGRTFWFGARVSATSAR
ncbi:MAG: TonB-dependent receptor [Gemmatimonadaceae bacterium]